MPQAAANLWDGTTKLGLGSRRPNSGDLQQKLGGPIHRTTVSQLHSQTNIPAVEFIQDEFRLVPVKTLIRWCEWRVWKSSGICLLFGSSSSSLCFLAVRDSRATNRMPPSTPPSIT